MSNSQTLVLLTTITPDPENRGGPSGLPWEIIKELTSEGWQVHTQLIPLDKGWVRRRLMQLALLFMPISVEKVDADAYIAYPFYLGRLIPPKLRARTLVLGPDAPSMLYARLARVESGWRRVRDQCLSHWFALHERWVIRHLAGMVVVGRNDARWLKNVVGAVAKLRVHYWPHPILSMVAKVGCEGDAKARPRLIFCGDLSRKYIGNFFNNLDYKAVALALSALDCEILVVGKGNRHIYEAINDHMPVSYEAWVDDYSSLCNPLRDVHVIPLMAGAGTKNRTLTALAMNLIILSTPIGVESIDVLVLRVGSIHRFRSTLDFKSALITAMHDLQRRRQIGYPPPMVHIDRINAAFRESIHNTLNASIPIHLPV